MLRKRLAGLLDRRAPAAEFLRVAFMHIEPASEADIPALGALLSTLFAQEAEFTPDPIAQQRGLLRIISHPEVGVVLVARQGAQLLGMVNLLYTVSTALGEQVALLEDMVVCAEARATGIGTQLLQAAVRTATASGCRRITLLTDESNHAAQRFYRRQGFEASSMLPMRLHLP